MSTHEAGRNRAESGPPGGLVEVLTRWEASGGHWEVLDRSDHWIEIRLVPADGTRPTLISGARTSVLRAFLADRTSSTQ